MGVKQGIVEKSGAWYSHQGDRIGQGRKNAAEFLDNNPELKQAIDERIRTELMPARGADEVPDGELGDKDKKDKKGSAKAALAEDVVVAEAGTADAS